jgi:hypothetical protein
MNRPEHQRRLPVGTRLRRGLLIALFVLLTLANAFWLLGFFGTLITDPSEIDGDAVLGFAVLEFILICLWVPLFRAVRRRGPRAMRLRRRGPRAMRLRRRGYPALTEADFRDAMRLPGRKRKARADVDLPDDGPLERLGRAEQALGNALYQLNLRPQDNLLSREQISALRVTGIEVSAWLSADGLPRRQLNDGIRHFADLAHTTENLLVGRASAADVDKARDRLVQLTTQRWR